jgi:hypothetical protein
MPEPTNVSELRSALGLMNYYRRHIPQFSAKAHPLNSLLKKDVPWTWGAEQQAAFESLKADLTCAPVMAHPDYAKPFIVQTDWSNKGMGAILSQLSKMCEGIGFELQS